MNDGSATTTAVASAPVEMNGGNRGGPETRGAPRNELSPPPSFRRRCDSMTGDKDGDQNESKVLVIYTGGTIGMIRNDDDRE